MIYHIKSKPEYGAIRIVNKFAWLPTKVMINKAKIPMCDQDKYSHTMNIWLENYQEKQEYSSISIGWRKLNSAWPAFSDKDDEDF